MHTKFLKENLQGQDKLKEIDVYGTQYKNGY